MAKMIITINGPFAYVRDYPFSQKVTLMAPMCPAHLAGISGIDPGNELILTGNLCNHPPNGASAHQYEWKGPAPLRCLPNTPGYDPTKWRCWLTLPMPDRLLPISPVNAVLIGSGPGLPQPGPFAVGVRFLYFNWDKNPISVLYNGTPLTDPNTGAQFQFQFQDNDDDHWDLDIDYAGPTRDDPNHEDAVGCFENLMRGLGLSWSIHFPPSKLLSTRQNDCKAAVAWVGAI
jgi:hypothetical protein